MVFRMVNNIYKKMENVSSQQENSVAGVEFFFNKEQFDVLVEAIKSLKYERKSEKESGIVYMNEAQKPHLVVLRNANSYTKTFGKTEKEFYRFEADALPNGGSPTQLTFEATGAEAKNLYDDYIKYVDKPRFGYLIFTTVEKTYQDKKYYAFSWDFATEGDKKAFKDGTYGQVARVAPSDDMPF